MSCKKRRIFVKYISTSTQERSYIGFRNTKHSNSRNKPHFSPNQKLFWGFFRNAFVLYGIKNSSHCQTYPHLKKLSLPFCTIMHNAHNLLWKKLTMRILFRKKPAHISQYLEDLFVPFINDVKYPIRGRGICQKVTLLHRPI